MRIVLIGPPGAGKGTQSVLMAEWLKVPHLSTGEILRTACAEKTTIGRQADQYMEQGRLVPDALVQEMVFKELSQPACQSGYVLDGFPRTVPQAQELDIWLERGHSSLSMVLEFRVTEEVLLERLADRGRADDARGIVHQRLQQYNDLTRPLIEYYQGRGVLKVIQGGRGSAEEVFVVIRQMIEDLPS